MTINPRELRKRIELDGAARTSQHLTESLKQGDLSPEDFSIRDLAESFIPGGLSQFESMQVLTESATDALVNTIGAVIDTKIKEAYNQEVFAVSRLVRTIPTRLDGEKIHAVGTISDGNLFIAPGTEYHAAGLDTGYIETPKTAKHGLIIPLTREAVFFDQTHHLLDRASEVGEILAQNKERRILEVVLGLKNVYRSNGGPALTTYAAAISPTQNWQNTLANELQDWESVERAEDKFGEMLDPISGNPILIDPNTVLVMPPKRHLAHRLFYASSLSYESGSSTGMSIRNPFAKYRLVSSRLAYQMYKMQPNADTTWFIGNFRKAFAYMENWPITVTQSLPGSEADFTQDVLIRFKASERGTPAVLDPRYVVRCQ